ncbi:MAG TPA: hypothetical protein CFH79_08855 [Sulfurospirillum sp. UBA11407]|nr:MAG TPA: hypothetical protein CFH79_08855 [Sulfurospirillum sp. UBA11407]
MMQISNNYANTLYDTQKTSKEEEKTTTFDTIYANTLTPKEDERTDSIDVEKFIEDLLSKGAAAFLKDLNQEKIDKMVEEFREKLLQERGDNPESLKDIDALVADFKKQLLEKLQDSLDNSKSELKFSTQAMIQTLLEMDEPQNSVFSKLLQDKEA